MANIRTRLERSVAVLAVIDYRRRKSRDPKLGAGLERFILERELKDLAEEQVAAPRGDTSATIDARKPRPA